MGHNKSLSRTSTANEYMQELPESLQQMVGAVYAMFTSKATKQQQAGRFEPVYLASPTLWPKDRESSQATLSTSYISLVGGLDRLPRSCLLQTHCTCLSRLQWLFDWLHPNAAILARSRLHRPVLHCSVVGPYYDIKLLVFCALKRGCF